MSDKLSFCQRSLAGRLMVRVGGGLAAALGAVVLSAGVANAATITVTTGLDEFDTTPNATCSLREAIQAANTNAPFGGCNGGTGPDTVVFAPSVNLVTLSIVTITPPNNDNNEYGDLDILVGPNNPLIIDGGSGVTVTAGAGFVDRIFDVLSPPFGASSATLRNLTILAGGPPTSETGGSTACFLGGGGVRNLSGGALTIESSVILSNIVPLNGGGVCQAIGGALAIINTTIISNVAGRQGGGVFEDIPSGLNIQNSQILSNVVPGVGGLGGGIVSRNGSGPKQIVNTVIANNRAGGDGGGVYNANVRSLVINNSTVQNNTAGANPNSPGNGGGIWSSAALLMNDTNVLSNTAIITQSASGIPGGGGIYITQTSLTMNGGQVSFNVVRTFVNNSTVGGGGVWSSGSATLNGVTVTHNLVERNSATTNVTAFGGGIFNSAQLTVNNSRVDFNRAEVDRGAQGGGIYNGDQLSSAGAQLTLQNSTVSTNTAKATFGIATGGGVHSGFVPGDTADVLSSEIRNNVAEGNFGANGGGVRSTGVLTLTSSVVISNAALGTLQPSNGGGVSTQSAPGTVLIADTQILTNLASTGGGWYNDTPGAQMNNSQVRFNTTLASTNPAEHGGGIYNTSPASINNSFITDNKAHEDGGGIYNAGPDVNVFNSEIALNAAGISGLGNGGGAYNAGGMFLNASRVLTNTAPGTGGGIHSGGSGFAFVGVQDSILRANNAGQSGGGLYVAAGSNASVNSSRVLSNTASVNGGGIYNAGTLFTNFSTIGGQNQAQQGGGIYNAAGGDISNAFAITITANSATDGAGLFNAGTVSFFQRSAVVSNTATSNGGGIYNSGTLNSVNNTLSGNGAPNGGGLYAVGGTANLTHTTIASHTSGNGVVVAATVAVSGTLLAYNTPSNCTAAVVNNGGSLSSDSTCGVGTLNTNPLLAPLAFNGGQTLNHALLPGSPALDQTGNCNSYTVFDDQRGVLRPQGTACDIGAFELEEADLEVSKSASPSPVIAGQVITYTVIVTNTSTSGAANNLVLTDTLFGGATFGGVVSSGGFALQSSTSSQAVFTLGSLGAGVSTTLVFTATAPASGPITNVVTVTSGNPDPNPANNTFTVTTQVTPAAYLSVVKSANYAALAPGIIAPSGQLTYIVVVTNNGPSAATLTVTDTLASGVSFVAATINGAPCTFSAPNVVCTTSAAIPAGSAATVLITVTAPATQNTVFTNTATASTPAFPFTPFSSNVVTLTTAGSADLAIFKSAAPSPVLAGQPIVYTVILQNLGPSVATNVVVTDVLQGGATFGNVLLAVGLSLQSSVTNAVTFTVSTLPAGSSVAVVYTVTAPSEGGLVTNTVMAASSTIDPVPTNNTASTTVTVTPVANLQISKAQTFSTTIAGTIPPSGTITYTLQVTNTGPSTASFVTVTDNLPAGLVFVSASGAGWSCSFSAPTVTCTRPTLSVGAAPAIQIVATAPVTPGLVLTNTATVNAATFPNTPVTSNSVSVKVQFRVFAPIVRK